MWSIRSIRLWSPNLDAWLVRCDSITVRELAAGSWLEILMAVIRLLPERVLRKASHRG
jgi:hypothetical protein